MRAGYALIGGGALQGIVLVAALVWALGWQQDQQAADIAQRLAATAAVVIGGFWANDRFIRERVAESRLDLAVSAELVRPGGAHDEEGVLYVAVTVGAENVGSTKVDLDHDYCALTVSTHELPEADRPADEDVDEASWSPSDRVWFVLQEQDAIEPGASFGDQRLLRLPPRADLVAVKLDLVVQSEDGGYWSATSVTTL